MKKNTILFIHPAKWGADLTLSTRITLGVLLLFLLATLVEVYFIGKTERNHTIAKLQDRLQAKIHFKSVELQRVMERLQRDVRFLSSTPPVQGIIRASQNHDFDLVENSSMEVWKRRLQEIFTAFINKAGSHYFQVRYIGVADGGRELVRADYVDGEARIISQEKLQQKGGRDYFEATLQLNPGEIYLSEINLNREHGTVELPHRRTLRAATPVHTSDGQLFGMVIINLDIGPALDNLAEGMSSETTAYLVNQNGDYLTHPDPHRTFGFDLGRRYRWQDDATITRTEADSPDDGTADRLQTFLLNTEQHYGMARTLHFDPQQPQRFVTLYCVVPEAIIDQRIAITRNAAIASALGVASLIGLLLFLYVRRIFAPLQQLTQAAYAIGEGHYDHEMPALSSGELGALASALRTMLEQINVRDKEIKQINAELVRSEAYANLIIDTTPEAILVTDGHGCITRVNPRGMQLFGYRQEEMLGQPIELLIPERFHSGHRARVQSYTAEAAHPRLVQGRELVGQHRDGHEIPLEIGLAPLVIEEAQYIIVAIADITQRKAAAAEIQRLNASLEQKVVDRTAELQAANRELESFAYAIAHDLRAPLRAMGGFSQALMEDFAEDLDAEAQVYLEQIVIGSVRMGELVDGLLTLSRSTRGELQRDEVDISALAERILNQLAKAEPGRQVTWDVEPDMIARGDGRMLEVMMQNLLGNAWKYTGNVPQPEIRVHNVHDNGQLLFCVSDNGAGFDMAHADKLFQPFQRLHRQEEFTGIGIGLATVQRIVHRHGGEIQAQSSPGQGARFCFTLRYIPANALEK